MEGLPNVPEHLEKSIDELVQEVRSRACEKIKTLHGIVLFDGLDEVQGQEHRSVIEEVEHFCEYFHSNRFLITCRTQNHRYKFEGFTDVEVADFKPEQVNRFIKRWFDVVVDNAESENLVAKLIEKLQQPENKQIAELAVTPVLLNLICSVFQGERGNLPKNRADLYKKGLRDLLEGLDESKGVQREPIYEELTPEAKEDLLTYLAVTLFEANNYFSEQEILEKLISERLKISASKATKVLKSIEEQSGLIVERSEGFWSFSHLTFQEYFTAKWFCNRADWQGLASHITEKHWREVFLLAAEMPRTDRLLLLMKQEIDEQFAKYAYLQDILTLAKEKSSKDYECINPAVVRSFYLKLILQKNSPVEFIEIGNLVSDRNLMFGVELGLDMSLFKALHHAQNLTNICKQDFAFPTLAVVKKQHTDTLYCSIQQAFRFSHFEIKLQQIVKVLKEQLPEQDSAQAFNNWWKANGKAWSDKLINVMNLHRNIGLDLQFTEEQKELIQEYYYANKLLVDCLKSSFDVSADVKREIEETLLLPFDEMEKRQKQM